MTGWLLFAAAFLACTVEAVETTTVVVAVGVTRGWRSPLRGMATAIGVLAIIIVVLGPAISSIPLSPLRLIVGALLLIFGLGWVRKAVLRASGYKDLHDEDGIYLKQVANAKAAGTELGTGRLGGDPYGFTLAFKAVLLEGLEVAFIVVTFGANAHDIPIAALAAVVAIALVVLIAVIVRGPLSKVPENTIKYTVGILLTSFGTFWGAEGAGTHWPGNDVSLLAIIPLTALVTFALIAVLRSSKRTPATTGEVAA